MEVRYASHSTLHGCAEAFFYRICHCCNQDWKDFQQAAGCTFYSYGDLRQLIRRAVEEDKLSREHPLAQKWLGKTHPTLRLTLAVGQLPLSYS
jgi:hypothetical protein